MGCLWLEADSHVEAVVSHFVPQHHPSVMVVFAVGGVLAILGIADIVQCIKPWQIAQHELFLRIVALILGEQAVYAVHAAVVVAVTVLELVAELQVERT